MNSLWPECPRATPFDPGRAGHLCFFSAIKFPEGGVNHAIKSPLKLHPIIGPAGLLMANGIRHFSLSFRVLRPKVESYFQVLNYNFIKVDEAFANLYLQEIYSWSNRKNEKSKKKNGTELQTVMLCHAIIQDL